jgi:DNA-binding NtrC family response regulator
MGKSIKVLIVEDTENDAALLIRALRRGGYDPVYEVVETPEAMSDALNRQEWDLVISDYSMPCFSGLDALKLLQDKDLDLSFILITGQVGEDVAVEAMKAGAHDYVLKSNPARLIPAVERELREAVMRRERRQAEKALQESEIRLRQITDNMLDMISLVDERGVFQYASPSHKNMLGYEPEFLIGKSILELSHLYHPDDVGRVLAEVRPLPLGGVGGQPVLR